MKRIPRFHILGVCGLLLIAIHSSDAQQPDAFPSVESISFQQGTRLEKDSRAEERSWMRNVILKASRDQWKGREWAAEAEALMEAVSDQIEKEYAVSQPLAPLADRFVSLLKKAADDPTLTTSAARGGFHAIGKSWWSVPRRTNGPNG